ncbi:unnamed protein product [marine sediment metagenome]|uniref:Uncharacterized protein n=1 Tax=marine sediment metagenome TaxID=412755 RepID=X1AP29_9ZZZZ
MLKSEGRGDPDPEDPMVNQLLQDCVSNPETQLGDSYNTSPTTGEDWEFRKQYYNKLPRYCGHNIIFDRTDPDRMAHVGCNRLSCPRCRPKVRHKLLDRIVEVAIDHGLFRQLILTCPGKNWRSQHSADYSFSWLNKKFDSFKVLYERATGKKLKYIKLPRSQKSGYCHHHTLIDQYIPQSLIEDIIQRIGIGSNYKIKHLDLQRLTTYLRNDFQKDHEWYIPVGMRHISSSMEIMDAGFRKSIFIMWLPGAGKYCTVVFGKYVPPQMKYDFVYDVVQNYADRPPPFWFFQECFTDMQHIRDNGGYVAELRKHYLPAIHDPTKLPAYAYQMEVSGKLHRITVDFVPEKFTTQKNFKRDTIKINPVSHGGGDN